MPDPKAWTKKYFKLLSVSIIKWEDIIKGIKDIKLISNPIHTQSHPVEDNLIKRPVNNEIMKKK